MNCYLSIYIQAFVPSSLLNISYLILQEVIAILTILPTLFKVAINKKVYMSELITLSEQILLPKNLNFLGDVQQLKQSVPGVSPKVCKHP